jgi:hypothetical protein
MEKEVNKYVFLTAMHDSGSSVLQYLLSTCARGISFTGYQKISEWDRYTDRFVYKNTSRLMTEEKDKIQNEKRNWIAIKSQFNDRFKKEMKYKRGMNKYGSMILILKSPANVLLARSIEEGFPTPTYFIVMTRGPYATIESTVRKLRQTLRKEDRLDLTRRAVKEWVECNKEQIKNIKKLKCCIHFKYEDMFDNPEEVIQKITGLLPELNDFTLNREIKHSVTHIGEFVNWDQSNKLSVEQIEIIEEELQKNRSVLEYLGYGEKIN